MSSFSTTSPFLAWADLALKTQEMLLCSGSVIGLRMARMARAGLAPSEADVAELGLMGREKLAAASRSGAAMARQWHSAQVPLASRALQQWLLSVGALLAVAGSVTPAQAAARSDAFVEATVRAAGAAGKATAATARVAQQGLQPIHAAVASNARRLAALRD